MNEMHLFSQFSLGTMKGNVLIALL